QLLLLSVFLRTRRFKQENGARHSWHAWFVCGAVSQRLFKALDNSHVRPALLLKKALPKLRFSRVCPPRATPDKTARARSTASACVCEQILLNVPRQVLRRLVAHFVRREEQRSRHVSPARRALFVARCVRHAKPSSLFSSSPLLPKFLTSFWRVFE